MQNQHRRSERGADRNQDIPLRGPSPDEYAEAIGEVTSHDLPGTPSIESIRTICSAGRLPLSIGRRTLREASIETGSSHGAKRSDAHVSRYELVAPIRQFDSEVLSESEVVELEGDHGQHDPHCVECGGREAIYRYNVNHFISGHQSILCARCAAVFDKEE